ncbi:uncharacterized protein E5676_scaffold306G002090 [Cucumis melo var. makuwa]|uniref:Ubiquitin-like protease family profile domain-containing protein n=1 Tax=Cucumis melo var. makuwa TaxID=1194695 RepID=A0A5D3D2X4_CUCMM|nr:uncharacterized protein E5676_scaffold306G002090 [Cucumis melo var. makuwa]
MEFCQDNMSIGLGKAKERDQNDDIGRPSSVASHIRPEKEQLMQAHLYVLENTNDVQPYIEYVNFKYLLYLFIYYVVPIRIYLTIVATELESPNNTIFDTLRWISHGPLPSVITYSSYVMNGIRYNTEHRDGVCNVHNSGVLLDCCSDDHLSVGADEDVAQVDCFLETSSQKSMRGPTTMIHLAQISSDANRLVVDYNERGEWIGENATQIGRPCSLAIGKVDNIVATGTVFERISTDEIVYGVRLGESYVRVLIELACDSHSLLPIPVVGSIYYTSSKKSRELEALKGTKSKMNELKLPMTIRFVLRHVEKDMKDEYLTIPVDTQEIFGYNFNVNVMKDSIKRLCLMEELALSVILSSMICLYESDPSILEEYAFMNPGQISKGLGTYENRARHLCNRLCAQQPGSTECGYYVMKFMKDIVRKKSITITDVQTRQAPYTQSELDMVRVEYCDFLGRYI